MFTELEFGSDFNHVIDRELLDDYARQVVRLQHPALLRIFDVCVDAKGNWALVKEALPEKPQRLFGWLSDQSSSSQQAKLPAICSIMLAVSEASAYLHQAEFRGTNFTVWGESARIIQSATGELSFRMAPPTPLEKCRNPVDGYMGCVIYSAPEAFVDGKPVPTLLSDSFSLGCLMFELLSGQRLINGQGFDRMIKELIACNFPSPHTFRPDIPDQLNDFVLRALAKAPEGRPSLREWSFVMENFGGRLTSLPFNDPPPAPGLTINAGDSTFTSLLEKPERPVTVNLLKSLGEGGMGNELLAEIVGDGGHARTNVSIPDSVAVGDRLRVKSSDDVDAVDCTVFAPPEIAAGETILVQVFAHTPEQAEQAGALATEFDEDAKRLGFRALEIEIQRGTRLLVELLIPSLEIDDSVQEVIWQGRPESVQFEVSVPTGHAIGNCIGKVTVYTDHMPIGHIKFKLKILGASSDLSEVARPLGDDSTRYRRAFISYASSDLDEVLKRVQMLDRCGVEYFQDLIHIEPGARWEKELFRIIDECDLFLLFWSAAAMNSEWVAREVQYAMGRKAGDDFAPPEVVPIIIEGPPVPEPPPELAHLHFNDRLLYYMSR